MKIFILTLLTVLLAMPAQAEIYKWVDHNGTIHFSDKPTSEQARKVQIRETGIELDSPPAEDGKDVSVHNSLSSASARQPAPQRESESEVKGITEEEYRITSTVGKLGGDAVRIAGRIGSGPKCEDMTVTATASNDNGLRVSITDRVRKPNSFGSVTFEGTGKVFGSGEDRGFWDVDTVSITCND